jgi:hypothetical protein
MFEFVEAIIKTSNFKASLVPSFIGFQHLTKCPNHLDGTSNKSGLSACLTLFLSAVVT